MQRVAALDALWHGGGRADQPTALTLTSQQDCRSTETHVQRERTGMPWQEGRRTGMPNETLQREQPRRHGWDRRRDHGRRIIRDRRREVIAVQLERRGGADRRSGGQRRARAERRTPPSGVRLL
jgi:hypothetical protein